MNKTELTKLTASACGSSIKETSLMIKAFQHVIASALQKGESVSIPGFGSFSVKSCPARMGRNPRTGEQIKIAAKRIAKFRPGTNLETAVQASKTTGKKGPAKKK